jgi:hypothetical protein
MIREHSAGVAAGLPPDEAASVAAGDEVNELNTRPTPGRWER